MNLLPIRLGEGMNHRKTASLLAFAGVLALCQFALAQPAERTARVCWVSSVSSFILRQQPYEIAFEHRLRELLSADGRNLVMVFGAADGRAERVPDIAAELARQNCDVFFAPGSEANLAAIKQASRGTPIVIVANDYDPAATGHITSLARPGGRITGVSQLQAELPAKRLELLKELLPNAKRVAVLSDIATVGQLKTVHRAAERLGLALEILELKDAPYDYDTAFSKAARTKPDGLFALASGHFIPARRRIPELALRHRLPSVFGNRLWPESGGLMSYGPNFSEDYRRAAEQVNMILKGAKPAEMPMEQPTKFELVINMKTAKTLGLNIPPSFLLRADELIE